MGKTDQSGSQPHDADVAWLARIDEAGAYFRRLFERSLRLNLADRFGLTPGPRANGGENSSRIDLPSDVTEGAAQPAEGSALAESRERQSTSEVDPT